MAWKHRYFVEVDDDARVVDVNALVAAVMASVAMYTETTARVVSIVDSDDLNVVAEWTRVRGNWEVTVRASNHVMRYVRLAVTEHPNSLFDFCGVSFRCDTCGGSPERWIDLSPICLKCLLKNKEAV